MLLLDKTTFMKKLENLKHMISDITNVEYIEIKIVARSFLFLIPESKKEKLIDMNTLDNLLLGIEKTEI